MKTSNLSRKDVHKGLANFKSVTLNQVLKLYNSDAELWTIKTEYGCTVLNLLKLMGINLDERQKLTYKACDEFFKLRIEHTEVIDGEEMVVSSYAVYRNKAIYSKAGRPIYVKNAKGEMKRLGVLTLQVIARDEWTPSLLAKVLEQNWCPLREAARAEKSLAKAKGYDTYYEKNEGDFEPVGMESIKF